MTGTQIGFTPPFTLYTCKAYTLPQVWDHMNPMLNQIRSNTLPYVLSASTTTGCLQGLYAVTPGRS